MDKKAFACIRFAKIAAAEVTRDQNRWLYFIK